jgi:hypothetical protein
MMTDPNPNPARISDELWRFRNACLALESGSNDRDGGIYADKPGYHATRDQNDPDDYSVRDAPDKKGPSDKSAAWDWIFGNAQNGDYSRISVYGKRMLAAWNAHDPRCNVLREFLGQTDTDDTPEGLDFRYFSKRTPDDSHSWHIHFSFVRAYIMIAGALEGVLSVLRGETLEQYIAAGGVLYKIDGTGEMGVSEQEVLNALNKDVPYQSSGVADWAVKEHGWSSVMGLRDMVEYIWKATNYNAPDTLAKVIEVEARLATIETTLAQIVNKLDEIAAGGGGGTVPPVDNTEVINKIAEVDNKVAALITGVQANAAAVSGA